MSNSSIYNKLIPTSNTRRRLIEFVKILSTFFKWNLNNICKPTGRSRTFYGPCVCMYDVRAGLLAYQKHWKPPLLFQHGRDIHYRLIDGDIWKTLPRHINTARIWPCTCLLAGHMGGGIYGVCAQGNDGKRVKWGCVLFRELTRGWAMNALATAPAKSACWATLTHDSALAPTRTTRRHTNTSTLLQCRLPSPVEKTLGIRVTEFCSQRTNLSWSDKNVYHLHDITTHGTHMIRISQTHVSTTDYFVFPEMFLLFLPLMDDNSKFRARRGGKSCPAGTAVLCCRLNVWQYDDDEVPRS